MPSAPYFCFWKELDLEFPWALPFFLTPSSLLSMFGKGGAVTLGVSPAAPVADVAVLAHISGPRPRHVVVNASAAPYGTAA